MAEFFQRLGERQALLDLVADQDFLRGQTLGLAQHFGSHRARYHNGAVLVGEDEVARLHDHALERRTGEINRRLRGHHPPAADRLHRCAIAGVNGEIVLREPAHVTDTAVDKRADAAALLHAERDQLAAVAHALAVTTPDADLASGEALAGLHLRRIALALIGDHLAGNGVGPAREAAGSRRERPELG